MAESSTDHPSGPEFTDALVAPADASVTPTPEPEGPRRATSVQTSEWVYGELREDIVSGLLPPNTRLVELQVAARFNVSRTPVREALKQLVAEGLVMVDPTRGLVVRDVGPVEVDEIYAIREVLDGLAARLAAQRITQWDLTKLHLLMEMMQESVRARRYDATVQANIKFHEVLYEAAGNRRLSLQARGLRDFIRRFSSKAFTDPVRDEEVLREHEELVKALEARDPDRAESAARHHMVRARQNLLQMILGADAPS